MSAHAHTTTTPTFGEIAEGTMYAASAIAVGAPALPGFLLTVPGLVVVALPVILVAVLAAAAGLAVLIAAVPVLVVRQLARLGRHAFAAARTSPEAKPATAEPMPA
jgi:hypothetical protein